MRVDASAAIDKYVGDFCDDLSLNSSPRSKDLVQYLKAKTIHHGAGLHEVTMATQNFALRRQRAQLLTPIYGVCDTPEQAAAHCDNLYKEVSDEDPYVILLTKIEKSEERGRNWRWSKWGDYIGTKKSQAEYLYDEPEIDHVYVFHVVEIKPECVVSGNVLAAVPDTISKYVAETKGKQSFATHVAQNLICKDGTEISIQASAAHLCSPRSNVGPWTHFEVRYGDEDTQKTIEEKFNVSFDESGIAQYVPVEKLKRIIEFHGGAACLDENKELPVDAPLHNFEEKNWEAPVGEPPFRNIDINHNSEEKNWEAPIGDPVNRPRM